MPDSDSKLTCFECLIILKKIAKVISQTDYSDCVSISSFNLKIY